MFDSMLDQLKQFQQAVLADDEVFNNQAKMLKKMYDALTGAGFTPEQATQIVAAQGTGAKTS
jgi:hypothetical protein